MSPARRSSDELALAVGLTLGRTNGDTEDVRLTIEDTAAAVAIIEVRIPLDAFARLVTGAHVTDVPARTWPAGLARLGTVRQNTSYRVPITAAAYHATVRDRGDDVARRLTDALVIADELADGGLARLLAVGFRMYDVEPNHHRINDDGFLVGLERWLPADDPRLAAQGRHPYVEEVDQ